MDQIADARAVASRGHPATARKGTSRMNREVHVRICERLDNAKRCGFGYQVMEQLQLFCSQLGR